MTGRSVQHGSFTIERVYRASAARVFAAWADPGQRKRWDSPGAWPIVEQRFDFRVGGEELKRFGPSGDPAYLTRTRYEDIVPDARIVFSYSLVRHGVPISVSLTSVRLSPDGGGTRLVLTEQAVFLDEGDTIALREEGWRSMIDKLGEGLG
jgi:uncharacterized protein YndB with AHSA1/START domain